jgi:hypothetical protein
MIATTTTITITNVAIRFASSFMNVTDMRMSEVPSIDRVQSKSSGMFATGIRACR